ncbi:MAG: hypothetical protein ACNA8L_12080 [Luteolibacter sp.]
MSMPLFSRYIGIDYSGAETPERSLPGLRMQQATPDKPPIQVDPPPSPRKHWTRCGIAEWLLRELRDGPPTLVGIDHGFSFPAAYFEVHRLPRIWEAFLNDFCEHWPTDDNLYVDFVREGRYGKAAARTGNTRWRRLTEVRSRAKSVFHFNVQGSVAKSTHAGLPWLRYLRRELGRELHFWPFDGWSPAPGCSVIAEVYPSLWSRSYPIEGRTPDQHDAYSIARWMRETDATGNLPQYFNPQLAPQDHATACYEGWILGLQ